MRRLLPLLLSAAMLPATAFAGGVAPQVDIEQIEPSLPGLTASAPPGSLTGSDASEAPETALLRQLGTGDVASLRQSGLNDQADVTQTGLQDRSTITQTGGGDRAVVWQAGDYARSTIVQTGSNNLARVRQ
ncbi:MAG TPA: hypothetical protein VGL66_11370 [Caulobacteraceae bacterium]|jgi:hypothetical protein